VRLPRTRLALYTAFWCSRPGSPICGALSTAPQTLTEAIGDGILNTNAQNCFIHDLKHSRVLCYSDPAIASAATSAAMLFCKRKEVGVSTLPIEFQSDPDVDLFEEPAPASSSSRISSR
jgi:hypothetical protein